MFQLKPQSAGYAIRGAKGGRCDRVFAEPVQTEFNSTNQSESFNLRSTRKLKILLKYSNLNLYLKLFRFLINIYFIFQ